MPYHAKLPFFSLQNFLVRHRYFSKWLNRNYRRLRNCYQGKVPKAQVKRQSPREIAYDASHPDEIANDASHRAGQGKLRQMSIEEGMGICYTGRNRLYNHCQGGQGELK